MLVRKVSGINIEHQHLAHAVGVAVGLLGEQRMRRGDHARRAEAALQRVVLVEALLQQGEIGVARTAPRP